jgi:uncharacterized protein with HEPN domain
MNPRDVRKFLFDIDKACRLILEFTHGVERDVFLGNQLLLSAVERQSEILGEALRQAMELDPALAERLTDVRPIIAFRNRLAYGYSSIDPETVWGIARNDVPRLLAEVRSIMDGAP